MAQLTETPKAHPGESLALAAAVASLVARALGVTDANTLTALIVVVGAVPSAVAWCVSLVRHK